MITVHHLDNSRSHRVLWLLEELGVPYEIKLYKRNKKTMLAPPELKLVHPLGKAPVVTDGDLVLAESGNIIETLIERYGPHLAPSRDSADFARFRYWLHYAEGSAMPPLLLKLVSSKIATAPVPFFIKPIVKTIAKKLDKDFVDPQLDLHFDHIDQALSQSAFFAGEQLSGADIMMSFPVEAAAGRVNATAGRPNLARWFAAIKSRPAYQRATEKGGPLTLGF
jgi:glutathione S-transferase